MASLLEQAPKQESTKRADGHARICVITSGHLSTSPRMLKAADSLADAGYRVRVVSTNSTEWARRADQDARRSRRWNWTCVDYSRQSAPLRHTWCGLRFRSAEVAARLLGVRRCPLNLAIRAYSRVHPELLRAALAEPADLYYGGTTGALAAVAAAGLRTGRPYALDLEDFHSAEQAGTSAAELANTLAERIESTILSRAAFLTAGSDAIATAYTEKYGVRPTTINNTFPLPETEPDLSLDSRAGLRLYWFSQTIGPGRGLEDVVRAMGLAGLRGELHLRGRPAIGYLDRLSTLAAESAPALRIVHHQPAPPDSMIDLCRGYDAGLALEQGHVLNRCICLTNKALTYMLAGLAVILTDTPGQRPLVEHLGTDAIVYSPGDVGCLAAGLKRWAENKSLLAQAKLASWTAARQRWHWEHPDECGALLEAVAQVFRDRKGGVRKAARRAGCEIQVL